MFHYTINTNQTVEEAIKSLETSLKEESFGVLWNFDIKETLQNKGFEYDQSYHVLEVCNPKEAKEILSRNQMAGYFLPCKIVVFEDAGETKIGMPRPTKLIEMVDDDKLKDFANNIEKRLIRCMDNSIA